MHGVPLLFRFGGMGLVVFIALRLLIQLGSAPVSSFHIGCALCCLK